RRIEVPDARGDFLDEVMVVRDQEHGPFIALESDVQCVDGFQVQVFVGSSKTRTLGFCSISLQKSRRAASPPESASVGLRPSSRWKSIWPSTPRSSSVDACGSNGRSQSSTVVPFSMDWRWSWEK